MLPGSFSSRFLKVVYDSELPAIDFSASFINKMKGDFLLSLNTTLQTEQNLQRLLGPQNNQKKLTQVQ